MVGVVVPTLFTHVGTMGGCGSISTVAISDLNALAHILFNIFHEVVVYLET